MGSRAGIFDELRDAPLALDEAETRWRSAMGNAEAAIICKDWATALDSVAEASRIVDNSFTIEGACISTWRRRRSASMGLFTMVVKKLEQDKMLKEARQQAATQKLH